MHPGQPLRIGAAIREARQELGWTQKQLAHRVNELRGYESGGCSTNDVYRWESGRRTPMHWLPFLIKVLNIDVGALAEPSSPTLAEVAQPQEQESPVDRREFITASTGAIAGVPLDTSPTRGRRVGGADVARLRRGLVDLRRVDDYTGGAATYPLAVATIQRTETLLRRASYAPATEQQLLAVLAETHQFTAWTAFDAGKMDEAKQFARRASAAANQAGNTVLAASALSELSYLTASGDSPREAVQMARASLALAPVDALPAVRVVLADRLAWACARTGDASGVDRAVGLVDDLHDRRDAREDEEPDWVYWINRDESQIMAGRCWAELRYARRAVPTLESTTVPYDDAQAREAALYQCWLGGAHLDAGDVDQAVAAVTQAVTLARGTDSPRTDVWVSGILQRMQPHKNAPGVRQLLEYAGDA
ncbi:helix-turn-helix domain-containing protein [Streptomyces yaizuensis]|uniref:Helix-turn-helix domain-containing protein n=1 Tax=Streptomyces yaizuensis TaxID=2989713 RepID=A0AA86J3S6_9ACTN|nr:helix-turn-helix domain-containing protein [Streptomyces sp. YSPA8]BDT39552.1 helix-turn-helix domain-containing protein [Streptomyces sp. YSPA8]